MWSLLSYVWSFKIHHILHMIFLFMSLFKFVLTLHSIFFLFFFFYLPYKHRWWCQALWAELHLMRFTCQSCIVNHISLSGSSQSLSDEYKLHFPAIHLHSDIIKNLTSKQTWNLKSNIIQKECTHTDHLQWQGSK